LHRRAAQGAGLDEHPRLPGDAALAGLGDGPRRGRRGRRRAVRVRAHRSRAPRRLPRCRRARRSLACDTDRGAPGGACRVPQAAPPQPPAGPRAAPRRGPVPDRASPVVSLGVSPGGRGEPDLPGLPVVGAAEVVTMAGGPRAGDDQGAIDRRAAHEAGGPGAPNAPAVAIWEGRVLGVGGRADLERLLAAEGYPLDRFDRLDAAGGTVTPGLVDPHTHLLFAGSR